MGCADPVGQAVGGDGGIRTLGAEFSARRFSKPLVSATHPRLRAPAGSGSPRGRTRPITGQSGCGNACDRPKILRADLAPSRQARPLRAGRERDSDHNAHDKVTVGTNAEHGDRFPSSHSTHPARLSTRRWVPGGDSRGGEASVSGGNSKHNEIRVIGWHLSRHDPEG